MLLDHKRLNEKTQELLDYLKGRVIGQDQALRYSHFQFIERSCLGMPLNDLFSRPLFRAAFLIKKGPRLTFLACFGYNKAIRNIDLEHSDKFVD